MKSYSHLIAPDLEQLLTDKSFEELNLEERSAILTEMSQREYNQLRAVAQASQAYFLQPRPELSPRPDLQGKLSQQLVTSHAQRREQRFLRLLRYPIPAWQAAAAMALLVCSIYLSTNGNGFSAQPQGPHNIIVDSTHMDSSLRPPFLPNEDSMVHLTSDTM